MSYLQGSLKRCKDKGITIRVLGFGKGPEDARIIEVYDDCVQIQFCTSGKNIPKNPCIVSFYLVVIDPPR